MLPSLEFIVSASRCPAAAEFVCKFLAEKEADIVLTYFPDDAQWEHYTTVNLVCTCVRQLAEAGRKQPRKNQIAFPAKVTNNHFLSIMLDFFVIIGIFGLFGSINN